MLEPATANSSTGHEPGRRPHSRRTDISRWNAISASAADGVPGTVSLLVKLLVKLLVTLLDVTLLDVTPVRVETGSPVIAPLVPPHPIRPMVTHHHFMRIGVLLDFG